MKLNSLILSTFLCLFAVCGRAQSSLTNAEVATTNTTVDSVLKLVLGGGITNVAVDPYLTYAPKAPEKFGGGLIAAYNFNQYAGLGLGLDWLGSFSLVSCDITLKAPFHVSTIAPSLLKSSFWQSVQIVPFAIVGVATPYSGDGKFNGSPVAVSDVGGYIEYGHLFGGQFNSGIAWGKWTGSGPYDVARYHAFFGWSYGF